MQIRRQKSTQPVFSGTIASPPVGLGILLGPASSLLYSLSSSSPRRPTTPTSSRYIPVTADRLPLHSSFLPRKNVRRFYLPRPPPAGQSVHVPAFPLSCGFGLFAPGFLAATKQPVGSVDASRVGIGRRPTRCSIRRVRHGTC